MDHDHEHDHVDGETGLEQSIEEMNFLQSACSAAQHGEADKLRRMLEGSRCQVPTPVCCVRPRHA